MLPRLWHRIVFADWTPNMFQRTVIAALILVCLSVCSRIATAAVDRPNVVLVMTDDQGYGDLGIHGNDQILTPNLDRFAREGVQFSRFYVSPVCAPTRASLMTGRNY